MEAMLKRMTGEELLMARVLEGDKFAAVIDHELDRRARFAPSSWSRTEAFWAGRNFAMRKSARLAA